MYIVVRMQMSCTYHIRWECSRRYAAAAYAYAATRALCMCVIDFGMLSFAQGFQLLSEFSVCRFPV